MEAFRAQILSQQSGKLLFDHIWAWPGGDESLLPDTGSNPSALVGGLARLANELGPVLGSGGPAGARRTAGQLLQAEFLPPPMGPTQLSDDTVLALSSAPNERMACVTGTAGGLTGALFLTVPAQGSTGPFTAASPVPGTGQAPPQSAAMRDAALDAALQAVHMILAEAIRLGLGIGSQATTAASGPGTAISVQEGTVTDGALHDQLVEACERALSW